MILVTGMHRSGTSCITGMLERCGFGLGTAHPVHPSKAADNPKGFFENLQMVAINETVLKRAGGTWYTPPPSAELATAGRQLASAFKHFADTFDGEVAKDPRSCMTIDLWETLCPGLEATVLCLRHPVAVARSLNTRNKIPETAGVNLWCVYVMRFLEKNRRRPVFMVDYDRFGADPVAEMGLLLRALGRPMDAEEIARRTEGFYEQGLNHTPDAPRQTDSLPKHAAKLYDMLKAQSLSAKSTRIPGL